MVKSCAAYNCTARFKKNGSISFHQFPRNGPLLESWLKQLRRIDNVSRKSWKPTRHSRLCSEHFKPDCFFNRNLPGSKAVLRSWSIPTEFNFVPKKMKSLKKLKRKTKRKVLPRSVDGVKEETVKQINNVISVNESIGLHGGTRILLKSEGPVTILTHCNTGSFATAKYGTALGVIHWLHQQKQLSHVYFTENPLFKKGDHLIPHELVRDNIPITLICESMVSALLNTKKITAVVVSADKVAANGDTVNKISTYHMAISAQFHGVPFYVASSLSTLDMTLENGGLISVEEEPHSEVTSERIPICGISWWDPSLDITPAELITGGIITEHGVFPARSLNKLEKSLKALYPKSISCHELSQKKKKKEILLI